MNIQDLKLRDVLKIVITDCCEGEAIVTMVADSYIIVRWLYKSYCYGGTSDAGINGLEMITEADINNGLVLELELLERPRQETSQWTITEKQIEELIESYESNKEDLERLEEYIRENGCTEDGLGDATESFEQGWNNALRYVFGVLDIKVE